MTEPRDHQLKRTASCPDIYHNPNAVEELEPESAYDTPESSIATEFLESTDREDTSSSQAQNDPVHDTQLPQSAEYSSVPSLPSGYDASEPASTTANNPSDHEGVSLHYPANYIHYPASAQYHFPTPHDQAPREDIGRERSIQTLLERLDIQDQMIGLYGIETERLKGELNAALTHIKSLTTQLELANSRQVTSENSTGSMVVHNNFYLPPAQLVQAMASMQLRQAPFNAPVSGTSVNPSFPATINHRTERTNPSVRSSQPPHTSHNSRAGPRSPRRRQRP